MADACRLCLALRALTGCHELGQDGFILIGTEAGLFPYDGAFIERADDGIPPGTWIRRITVDDLGHVWVIAGDSLYLALRTSNSALWARSLGRLAWCLADERRFSTVAIPSRDPRFFTIVPDRLQLVSDNHGGIITLGDEGLLRWHGNDWHVITHHDGGLAAAPIQALMLDREDSLWVGSLGHGAFRSIGLGAWESWTADDGLTSDLIWAMTRLRDGQF